MKKNTIIVSGCMQAHQWLKYQTMPAYKQYKILGERVLDWASPWPILRTGLECSVFIRGWSQGAGKGRKRREKAKKECVVDFTAVRKRAALQWDFWDLSILRAFIYALALSQLVDVSPWVVNSSILPWCACEDRVCFWGFWGKVFG